MSEYRGFSVWSNGQAWFAKNLAHPDTADRVHGAHFAGGTSREDIEAKIDSYYAREPRGSGVVPSGSFRAGR